MSPAEGQAVVLVHGLWLSGWAMALLARRLRGCGFRPCLFSYPSVRCDLRENAARLRSFSDRIEASTVHYVGHSLGGVVIQTMFAYSPPPRPGRIVTLASPHRGSRAARALAQRPWGRRILGASIAALLRGEPPRGLPDRDVGLIKAARPFGLGRLFVDLAAPNDGVLALDEMHWPGARDEITLDVSHTGMLISREVGKRVCEFLQLGRFVR